MVCKSITPPMVCGEGVGTQAIGITNTWVVSLDICIRIDRPSFHMVC